jgi:hypothetical protein
MDFQWQRFGTFALVFGLLVLVSAVSYYFGIQDGLALYKNCLAKLPSFGSIINVTR